MCVCERTEECPGQLSGGLGQFCGPAQLPALHPLAVSSDRRECVQAPRVDRLQTDRAYSQRWHFLVTPGLEGMVILRLQ